MDIKEYSYILAIVDNGNISKAAQALYISQPSLSIFLKNLENRIGTKLFDRRDGKMVLTYEGERYADYARKIVALNDNLEQELDDIKKNNVGRIRIGIMLSRGTQTLPVLLKGLREEYPNIDIRITEASQTVLEDLLQKRELDLAFINYPFINADLECTPLSDNYVVLAAPKKMGLSSFAKNLPDYPYPFIDLKELPADTPYVLLKPGRSCRDYAERIFRLSDIRNPNIIFETSLITTAYSVVKAGLCGAFIYDSYYNEAPSDNVEIFSVGDNTGKKYVAAFTEKEHISKVLDLSISLLTGISWKSAGNDSSASNI